MISCFILITKQHILCRQCKENLHSHKLAGAERIKKHFYILIETGKNCYLTASLKGLRIFFIRGVNIPRCYNVKVG